MGDPMKVLAKKIKAVHHRNTDHLSLPSVHPHKVLAAKRRNAGAHDRLRLLKAAHIMPAKLPPIPAICAASMTHGVVTHYVHDDAPKYPLLPLEPIMTPASKTYTTPTGGGST